MFEFKNTIIEIVFHMISIFTLGVCVGGLIVYFGDVNATKLAISSFLISIILCCAGWMFDDKSKKELGRGE